MMGRLALPRALFVVVAMVIAALALAACGGGSSSTGSSESGSASGSEAASGGGESSGAGGASSEAGGEGSEGTTETTSSGGTPSWCGPEEISLALADEFGDNNWQKITRKEAEDEAAECPSVTEFKYTDGQGNTPKAISDLEALTAEGTKAIVDFPHDGKVMLPAITNAYKAGVTIVPYRVFPGGEAGVNYNNYVSTDFKEAGQLWGEWIMEVLKGKGKVLTLGGPAANSQSTEEYEGFREAIKGSEIELLGEQPYTVTEWEPAKTQQVISAALAKYPEIDAITTDFGAALASSFSAFEQANREIPAIATEDSNELGCDQKEDGFPLFTVDSQNWMVRTAIQFAVAEATGGTPPSSTEVPQKAFENSVTGKPNPVQCDKSLTPEAILSAHLPKEQMEEVLK
jgi:ABC-type sugar transport system substrate-binding protein